MVQVFKLTLVEYVFATDLSVHISGGRPLIHAKKKPVLLGTITLKKIRLLKGTLQDISIDTGPIAQACLLTQKSFKFFGRKSDSFCLFIAKTSSLEVLER